MAKHRVLIVGAGFWGEEWIKAVQACPMLTLAGLAARTRASLQAVAERFALPSEILYDDYRQAIDKADADIVAVVTPPATHLPIVQAALAGGKHVICEKPLAESWVSARQVAASVAAHANRKFMVAQTRRYVPQVQTIRQFIAEGRLGRVSFITFDHRVYDTDAGWRLEMYSPVLEDMSIHHFDAFRYITGQEPDSVFAEGWNPPWSQYPSNGCHEVFITMTGDVHVNYFASWTTQGQQNSYDGVMKIVGEKGSLDLVDAETLLFYPGGIRQAEVNPPPQRVPMRPVERREIAGIIHDFLDAVDRDATPPCNIDDNLASFAMVCAAIESCRTDRRVNVNAMLNEVTFQQSKD